MTFLNPLLLLGLLGVALPIAAHLLNRARPRRLPWAAMSLLKVATVTRSRRIRLEDLLLMLLRCAAIALLALAAARPTLRGRDMPIGDRASIAAVIAVDASMSMDGRHGVASRFERALDRARQIIATLDADDPVTIVLMAGQPRTVLSRSPVRADLLDRLLQAEHPSAEPMTLEANLEAILASLEPEEPAARECYIITDAQQETWANLSPVSSSLLEQIRRRARVFFVNVADEQSDNAAVTDLSVASGLPRTGAVARCVAQVRNFSDVPLTGLTVTLTADDQAVDEQTIDLIPAGGVVSVPLFVRFRQAGITRLTARIGDDALTQDNQRHAVVAVRDRVRVLCVDGDPQAQPWRSETDYLMRALSPPGYSGMHSGVTVRVTPWDRWTAGDLDTCDVVFLANVPDVSVEMAARLSAFVRGGGGLIVFTGDRTTPTLLSGTSLLPASLGEAEGDAAKRDRPMHLRTQAQHPIAAVLGAMSDDALREAEVFRYTPLTPVAGAQVAVELAEPASPLIVEHAVGAGRVVLIGTSADRDWSDLVIHPAYPLLLHQTLAYVTGTAAHEPMLVGEQRSVRVSPGAPPVLQVRDASGLTQIMQVAQRDGEPWIDTPPAIQPGFLTVSAEHAQTPLATLAVNTDPRESDLRPVPEADLARWAQLLGLDVVNPDENLGAAIEERRVGRELWRPLLLAALACFVFESLLARRASAAMNAGEPVRIRRGRAQAAPVRKAYTRATARV